MANKSVLWVLFELVPVLTGISVLTGMGISMGIGNFRLFQLSMRMVMGMYISPP